jgi:(E)-4-hydroxy-3-methylbut-2-enyl-diphosphate synthase
LRDRTERNAQPITIGGFDHVNALTIGGDSPVVIQTMWADRLSLSGLDEAAKRIEGLARMGCGLVRFAVPDLPSAETLGALAGMVSMPLAADIHFDYKIALRCMDFPIAKIRINPGNIGTQDKVKAVLEKAASRNIPIRIGVNAGSLPQDLRNNSNLLTQRHKGTKEEGRSANKASSLVPLCLGVRSLEDMATPVAHALVEAAMREVAIFEEFGFHNYLVSMKATGIADTISANRIFAAQTSVPLHIGVTEAGPLIAGVARSAAALSTLLAEGIGDTVRVSLSDTMENEVIAAREICNAAAELATLSGNAEAVAAREAARLRRGGVTVISCPRCGRCGFDTHGFTERWLTKLYALNRRITVAIMGCEVNGPQEAKHADLGITGNGSKVLIFRHGEVVRAVSAEEADSAFEQELGRL